MDAADDRDTATGHDTADAPTLAVEHKQPHEELDTSVAGETRPDTGADEPGERGRYDLDQHLDDHSSPRAAIEAFEPRRAGLPELTGSEITGRLAEADPSARTGGDSSRPWLRPARDREPGVQRVIVTAEAGRGHAVERHEGVIDDTLLTERGFHPDRLADYGHW